MQYLDTERFPLPEGYRFRSITVRRMTVDDLRLITAGYDTVPEDEEERMINLGGPDVRLLNDGWTVVTEDGALSAQFEHTVLVTKTGHEVLTAL